MRAARHPERGILTASTAQLYAISRATLYRLPRGARRLKDAHRADRGQPRAMPAPAIVAIRLRRSRCARIVVAHATLPLVKLWGAGNIASADKMRFTAPASAIHAGPNPRYFGQARGVSWYKAAGITVTQFGVVQLGEDAPPECRGVDKAQDVDGFGYYMWRRAMMYGPTRNQGWFLTQIS